MSKNANPMKVITDQIQGGLMQMCGKQNQLMVDTKVFSITHYPKI